MAGIDHLVERLGVVDVRGPAAVLIASGAAVGLAVAVEILEVHPHPDLGGAPCAAGLGAAREAAQRAVPQVLDHVLVRVRHVAYIEDPESGLPIGPVDVGPAVARVVRDVAGPGLHRHVVDVDPASTRGLPRDLCLADLDYPWQVAEAGEVEVRDGDAAAGISLADVA